MTLDTPEPTHSFTDFALAIADLECAASLARASYKVANILHHPAPGLTPAQQEQRKVLLQLAVHQLRAERDRVMDSLVHRWTAHRGLVEDAVTTPATQSQPTVQTNQTV